MLLQWVGIRFLRSCHGDFKLPMPATSHWCGRRATNMCRNMAFRSSKDPPSLAGPTLCAQKHLHVCYDACMLTGLRPDPSFLATNGLSLDMVRILPTPQAYLDPHSCCANRFTKRPIDIQSSGPQKRPQPDERALSTTSSSVLKPFPTSTILLR